MRFPTLTRLFFDTPSLPTRFGENSYEFADPILERICNAFNLADAGGAQEDIWTELTASNADFIKAMREKDFQGIRAILSNLFHGPLLFGMGHTDIFLSKRSPYDRQYFPLRCRDATLALAEALALKSLASNQQTSLDDYVSSTNADVADYIQQIEEKLRHSIEVPEVGKPPIAEIGRYRVSPDSVRHAYVMYRVKQLGHKPEDALLEIGGGFGNVARYAFLQGFRDYTIVDIPYVAAIQAAFLAATVGEDNISLLGEDPVKAIKICPSTRKNKLPETIDLAINMDSLPEINKTESLEYLNLIRSKSRNFLSINQEAQKTHKETIKQYSVPDLINMVGGFRRLHRHPYWMEQGYAEEYYAVDAKDNVT
ncbi:putative sugar O-methyltransferase [Sneathiella sp.]|uniref:putative sugar O-methyltransferase n=1 Tax=Sneathiella sp. TaxID=1964365 RepID=UPI002607DD2D|nr:putative sugar O-methyltransferase [Sneathiella sp.]MDF2367553.1 putative sugar O-methyltransferase [Sneathiella sp.]